MVLLALERGHLDRITSPVHRYLKSRIFRGRLTELQCAEWLEAQGWVIEGLEALRQGPDIEAITSL